MPGQKSRIVSAVYGMNALLHQMLSAGRVVAQGNSKSELVPA